VQLLTSCSPEHRQECLCHLELLNGEANGLDEDGVAGLDGDIVVAGFDAGDFDNDFVRLLGDDGGFVIVFFVGEEDGGDFGFTEIFSGYGDGVVGFAHGGIDTGDVRIVLRQSDWNCDGESKE